MARNPRHLKAGWPGAGTGFTASRRGGGGWRDRREGARASEEELRAFRRQALAAYKVPRVVEFRASLPRTATGKIRKVELAGA